VRRRRGVVAGAAGARVRGRGRRRRYPVAGHHRLRAPRRLHPQPRPEREDSVPARRADMAGAEGTAAGTLLAH